jgi:hypothetical protein
LSQHHRHCHPHPENEPFFQHHVLLFGQRAFSGICFFSLAERRNSVEGIDYSPDFSDSGGAVIIVLVITIPTEHPQPLVPVVDMG